MKNRFIFLFSDSVSLPSVLQNRKYSLISIRQNYNFDMLAIIWHEIVCRFLKIYQDLKRFVAQEHRIVLFWLLDVQNNFMFPTCKIGQEQVKNQKSTVKHSSFNGSIQDDIEVSDIYLAVLNAWRLYKFIHPFTNLRISK